jgi:hypothetical protein
MIFQKFSVVAPFPVARQDCTVTPTGVARQTFPCRKRRRMYRILSRQRMWRPKRATGCKLFSEAVNIEIFIKKGVKYKNRP